MQSPSAANPARSPQAFREDARRFEAQFRSAHPVQWWASLLGPFLVSIALLAWLGVIYGGEFLRDLLLRALAAFFVFGKFAILEPTDDMSSEALFGLVLYMDLFVSVLLSFHMAFMFRLPFVGDKLLMLTRDGEFVMEAQPWMRRMTLLGLVAFVTFPVAATGSVGGTLFGRLLGLRRRTTLVGVGLGSLLGCGLMYFGAGFISAHFDRDDPLLKAAGVAFVLLVLWWLNSRYRTAKQRAGY